MATYDQTLNAVRKAFPAKDEPLPEAADLASRHAKGYRIDRSQEDALKRERARMR